MEKIIHSLISNWIKGVDIYTHNGSTWLIFTDSKKWVIELTESKTLWYNYNFFKQIFEFTSLDVVENQHYITKWVEDNIINKVKHTVTANNHIFDRVEDAIQNGVKYTSVLTHIDFGELEDTLQNGVKETIELMNELPHRVKKIIKKGVKETNHVDVMKFFDNKMDETIENGVRHTLNTEYMPNVMVEDAIQNGVKETKTPGKDGDILSTIEWMNENKSNSYTKMIDDVIDNGIKETKHANKYNSIGPVIKEGKINDIIDNGVKVSGTFVGGNRQKENIESVIGYGTKNPTD